MLSTYMRKLRKGCRSPLIRKQHVFEVKTFTQPTACDHCGTLLLGLSDQVRFISLCCMNWSSSGIAMFIFELHDERTQGMHRGMLFIWWIVKFLPSPVLGGQMWCGWKEGGLSEKKSPPKEEEADDAGKDSKRSRCPLSAEFETWVEDKNLPPANFLWPLWPNVGWAVPPGDKLKKLNLTFFLRGFSVHPRTVVSTSTTSVQRWI